VRSEIGEVRLGCFDTVEKNLDRALELATDCASAYREAPESVRRMFNQVFFERVLVFPDDNAPDGVRVDGELREPFDLLLGADLRLATATATKVRKTKKTANQMVDGLASSGSPQVLHIKGLSKELLVEVRGFEPLTS
jgi:site-specific DNA recombinase